MIEVVPRQSSAVHTVVDLKRRVSRRLREFLRSPALGLLDVLADCAWCHIVLLGDLRVGQPVVEVVGHQLLDALPPKPHQEAALLDLTTHSSLAGLGAIRI